jgi:hypothetical protein
MVKTDGYREALTEETNWDAYLLSHSGLPGPRGNIELGTVAGELASRDRIRRWLEWDAQRAPTNTPEEFLAFCGVLGLGRLVAEGDHGVLLRYGPGHPIHVGGFGRGLLWPFRASGMPTSNACSPR